MPFDKQNSRGNRKTFVINRIMQRISKRHKKERTVSKPGFRITYIYSPPGKGPQFIRALFVCTVLTWRGSLYIPHKCWWVLDLSLSPPKSGWLFAMPGLSQPAFHSIPQDKMPWLIHSQRGIKHTDPWFSLCFCYFNHPRNTGVCFYNGNESHCITKDRLWNWISEFEFAFLLAGFTE